MGEEIKHTFNPKELATALVKNKNIHDGLWMVYVEFKLIGMNAGPEGKGPDGQALDIYPAALLPIIKFGIIHTAEPNPLTVDASIVNPKPKHIGKNKPTS